jgi:shikimate dehydrogenase
MAFAAAAAGCTICLTARRPAQAESLAADVRRLFPTCRISCLDLVAWRCQAAQAGENGADGWILLNGTPVGLWPHPAAMPVEPDDLRFCRQVYDTIYNPVATRLVLSARSRGIPAQGGLGMLFAQAVAAQEIWHPGYHFAEPIKCRVRQQLARAIISQSPLTFVMTGFMGCGKTTLGRALAELLELPFVDLDQSIEQDSGRTIPDIFATDGEAAFRSLEQAALRRMIGSGRSQVLATGGGALLAEQARQMLRSGPALVIYLDVTMDKILSRVGNGGGRPMLSGRSAADWSALYEQRQPLYRDLADLVFRPGEDVSENVRRIASLLGLSA